MLQNYQENTSLCTNHATCKPACELIQLVQLVGELKPQQLYMLKKEL